MSRAGPPVAEHRTSLRRLSSLSSLATLNPFHRRRSNNVSDAPPPSQDGNYAVTARYLGKGSHTHLVANSTSLPNSDEVVVSQPKPTLAHSRRSYIPLPDDSYAPLPHSRTVSNLPVPVKAIKAGGSASFSTSKSTAMLPPAQGNPTPPNQSAKGRLTSATKGILKTNRSTGLKRSDTMPLLNTNPELPCVSSTPRRTAFKENLTLSPIKPLPKMRMFSDEAGFHSPYQGDLPTIGRRFVSRDSILNSSADPTSRQAQHSASSPTKRNAARQHAVSRIVTSSGTQPVLKRMSHGAKTSKRVSYGAEIKQHQLLTPKAPPTPVAPLMRPSAVHSQARSVNNSSSVRKKQDTSPCGDRGTALPLVTVAEPVEYWCGRMSALTDGYRNKRFTQCLELGEPAKLENEQETHERVQQAMQELYSICTTEEAKRSFKAFHKRLCAVSQIRHSRGIEEANATFIPWNKVVEGAKLHAQCQREQSVESEDGSDMSLLSTSVAGSHLGSMRKMSFMDRLLGKNRASVG